MSKYTPRFIKLLVGSDDFSLLIYLQRKYQTYYTFTLYGTCMFSLLVPNIGIEFSFCGNNYMIFKSKIFKSNIDDEKIGLLILSHVFVPSKYPIEIMSFFIHFIVILITWILLITNIVFPRIVCAWTIIILKK
jgi:hypothetical protein